VSIRETGFPGLTFKSHCEIETRVQIVHRLWGNMRLSALCVGSSQVHNFRENKMSIKTILFPRSWKAVAFLKFSFDDHDCPEHLGAQEGE
jgi:hypothetical protein